MKKIVFFVTVAIALCFNINAQYQAVAEDGSGLKVNYDLVNGNSIITGYKGKSGGSVKYMIPDEALKRITEGIKKNWDNHQHHPLALPENIAELEYFRNLVYQDVLKKIAKGETIIGATEFLKQYPIELKEYCGLEVKDGELFPIDYSKKVHQSSALTKEMQASIEKSFAHQASIRNTDFDRLDIGVYAQKVVQGDIVVFYIINSFNTANKDYIWKDREKFDENERAAISKYIIDNWNFHSCHIKTIPTEQAKEVCLERMIYMDVKSRLEKGENIPHGKEYMKMYIKELEGCFGLGIKEDGTIYPIDYKNR